MEKNYLQEIVNKTASSIVTEEESICITFEDGLQLTVFNNYAVEKAAELSDFIGAHAIEVDESPVNVAITFQNGAGLNISLEDEDWNGPEAIELILSDGQIIVWNWVSNKGELMDRHTICRRILMRFQFAFVLCSFFCGGLSYADSNVVETAIGKLVISHDRKFSYSQGENAFGVEKLYQEFESIYQNQIRKLPIEDRVDFFWSSMWHLGFDGHAMYQFQNLIANDCGAEFLSKLQSYIAKEEEFQRDKSRLYLTKKVHSGLDDLL